MIASINPFNGSVRSIPNCPCGGEPVLHYRGMDDSTTVECPKRKASSGKFRTADAAMEAWDETIKVIVPGQFEEQAKAKLIPPLGSSITSRIGEARHEAIVCGISDPKRLYVGLMEYAAVREAVKTTATMLYESHGQDNPLFFMGLRVYRVLEPEHLRVC